MDKIILCMTGEVYFPSKPLFETIFGDLFDLVDPMLRRSASDCQ